MPGRTNSKFDFQTQLQSSVWPRSNLNETKMETNKSNSKQVINDRIADGALRRSTKSKSNRNENRIEIKKSIERTSISLLQWTKNERQQSNNLRPRCIIIWTFRTNDLEFPSRSLDNRNHSRPSDNHFKYLREDLIRHFSRRWKRHWTFESLQSFGIASFESRLTNRSLSAKTTFKCSQLMLSEADADNLTSQIIDGK